MNDIGPSMICSAAGLYPPPQYRCRFVDAHLFIADCSLLEYVLAVCIVVKVLMSGRLLCPVLHSAVKRLQGTEHPRAPPQPARKTSRLGTTPDALAVVSVA